MIPVCAVENREWPRQEIIKRQIAVVVRILDCNVVQQTNPLRLELKVGRSRHLPRFCCDQIIDHGAGFGRTEPAVVILVPSFEHCAIFGDHLIARKLIAVIGAASCKRGKAGYKSDREFQRGLGPMFVNAPIDSALQFRSS